MSKAEILAELPKLKAEERRQIYQRLCELQEEDLLNDAGPSEQEKDLLDAALAEYEKDGERGRPWREVVGDLQNELYDYFETPRLRIRSSFF